MRASTVFSVRRYVLCAILASLALLVFFVSLVRAHAQTAQAPSAAPVSPSPPVTTPSHCIVQAPNPYYRAVTARKIDTIVLHYSSGINVDSSRWEDPWLDMAIFKRLHVSAHYLLDRAGTIYQLVPEQDIAFHAGGSIMPAPDNRRNVNAFSIGIEMIATADSGYSEAEYAALGRLISGIESRYPIRYIVGHDQISGARAVGMGLRKDVKIDPGPKFDWGRVALPGQ